MIDNSFASTVKGSIIAIHQPNYFPWLGYFNKIFCSDVFVFHDNVKFTKRGFTKRTLIRAPISTEKKYLTVPLEKHSDFSLIKDLKVDNTKNWQSKHLNQIRGTYHKSPYFKEYFSEISDLIQGFCDVELLIDVNVNSIRELMEMLSIKVPTPISSKLPVKGKKSEYNINLVKLFQGTIYLSGTGARKYQAEAEFANAGIELIYQEVFDFIEKNPYYQAQGKFINGLSVLDALFNIGVDGIIKIFEEYRKSLFTSLNTENR
ncbi:MAG: WbqC family protein [Candidatus Thorarchaeota archaeon]